MLLNLLTNAVKYTESGHVRLVATLLPSAALDAPGRSVPPNEVLIRFAVEDTGCGIPTVDVRRPSIVARYVSRFQCRRD